jgi:hypothetical protein
LERSNHGRQARAQLDHRTIREAVDRASASLNHDERKRWQAPQEVAMDIEDHTPSLAHLRDFTRSRSRGTATHVASDRMQVLAPPSDRFFAFAYERFLSRVIDYVRAGNRGGALERAVFEAPDRMKPSYQAAARGVATVLEALDPNAVERRQRNVIVADRDGYELVSLRVHLLFESAGQRTGAFMYFSEKALSEPELAIMETAVALAVRNIDPSMTPAIIMVRKGEARLIDPQTALSAGRIAFLRAESIAYRAAWSTAE